MKRNSNNTPKICLILVKDENKRYMYPSHRKTQFFIRNKAKGYLKKGYKIIFVAAYKIGNNSMTCHSVADLNWCYNSFVKECSN